MNPQRPRHEGGMALCAQRAGRRRSRRAAAARGRRGIGRQAASARSSTHIFARRIREADEFYAARIADKERSVGRRAPRRPAGVRRAAVRANSSITSSVKDWLDGDPDQPPPPAEPQERPQPRLAAPVQSRRHLDAGQMGVPVVRGVGPGVSHAADGPGRRRVRQGATAAVPARMVHAPERPDSGLRIRVRRRESAGPRLGLLAGLQDDRRARPARPAVPAARVSQAAH